MDFNRLTESLAGETSTCEAPPCDAVPTACEATLPLSMSQTSTSSPCDQKTSADLSVEVVSFDRLTNDQLHTWERIRATRSEFATPFFSARFSSIVHTVRGDVEVAIIRAADEPGNPIVGFLPFNRLGKIAYPVGRCLNDAHNIIATHQVKIDWLWLLDQINVKAYDFHAMVGADLDGLTDDNYVGTVLSFCSELGDDSEAFLKRLAKQHRTIQKQGQKTRKMIREIGPVELEIDCRDPELMKQTIQWKRNQYQRTDILDFFSANWTRGLVTGLHEETGFHTGTADEIPGTARGYLSVLRAGGNVVAAHYGMIENNMLHYWFPAYDPKYSIYSPGTALFTAIVAAASENGIRCIDMGYGEQPYKLKQTDTTSVVGFGSLSRSKFHLNRRRLEAAAKEAIKKAPMKGTLKRIRQSVLPGVGRSKLN